MLDANGGPVATGKLIEGSNGGMATWADLKAQARDLLGIQLTDHDVGNVPLLAHRSVRQLHSRRRTASRRSSSGVGADWHSGHADDVVVEGDPARERRA